MDRFSWILDVLGELFKVLLFTLVWAGIIWLVGQFTPLFSGLSFSPYWLLAPIFAIAILTVIIGDNVGIYISDEDFLIIALIDASIIALSALYIWLMLEWTDWLDGLGFSAWWLLLAVALICVLLTWLSTWSELYAIALVIIAAIVILPVAIVTAPIWATGTFVYITYDRDRRRQRTRAAFEEVMRDLGDPDKQESAKEAFVDTEGAILPHLHLQPEAYVAGNFHRMLEVNPSLAVPMLLEAHSWSGEYGGETIHEPVQQAAAAALMEWAPGEFDRILEGLRSKEKKQAQQDFDERIKPCLFLWPGEEAGESGEVATRGLGPFAFMRDALGRPKTGAMEERKAAAADETPEGGSAEDEGMADELGPRFREILLASPSWAVRTLLEVRSSPYYLFDSEDDKQDLAPLAAESALKAWVPEEFERIVSRLESEEKKQAQHAFDERIWPCLGLLSDEALQERLRTLSDEAPTWALGVLFRATAWLQGYTDYTDKENLRVQETSLSILRERFGKPESLFEELGRVAQIEFSDESWTETQLSSALGRIGQALDDSTLDQVVRLYALLLIAPRLFTLEIYDHDELDWLYRDLTWAEDWLVDIFPGWQPPAAAEELTLESLENTEWNMGVPFSWDSEVDPLVPTGYTSDQPRTPLPEEQERVKSVLQIATDTLGAAADLPHGSEQYMAYELLHDCELARDQPALVALSDHGSALFAIPEDQRLDRSLVERLDGFIEVCRLLQRSERLDLGMPDRLAFYATAMGRLQSILQTTETDFRRPDRWFCRQITQRWMTIVAGQLVGLKARSYFEFELSKPEPVEDGYALNLILRNRTEALAENVRVYLDPDNELEDDGLYAEKRSARIDFIQGGREAQFRFELEIDRPGTYRIPFRIHYSDLESEDKQRSWADKVDFAPEAERPFTPLEPNPYVTGKPLKHDEMFFGREEVVEYVLQNLSAGDLENLIVLYGERRTGKTSVLYHLYNRLPEPYIPIMVDLQLALDLLTVPFWHHLAVNIYYEFKERGFDLKKPTLDQFAQTPAVQFEKEFVAQLGEAAPGKKPVLLIDEFNVLEREMREGHLARSTLENLRSIMQHSALSFVFAGSYDVVELSDPDWLLFFNPALWKRMELLDKESCHALITEPVEGYFDYDPYAIDKIWRVSAGHPYIVQLLCHELVNYGNERQIEYFTVQHVDEIIENAIDVGQIHLSYVWNRLPLVEQQFLVVVSELLEKKGIAVMSDIRALMAAHGLVVSGESIVRELMAKAILEEQEGSYAFRIGLIQRWIYATQSMVSLTR